MLAVLESGGGARGQSLGGLMDGAADTHVGRAAADVAGHGGVDIRVARMRIRRQQRGRRHELTALAVTALRHIQGNPRLLHGVSVPQCGYCQSGQLMSAAALLASNPHPSDADIDSAMAGNICRCATYVRIRGAIHQAAETLSAGATA